MQCGRVGGRHLYKKSPEDTISSGLFRLLFRLQVQRSFSCLEGSVAHTTRGRDGRQEGRECGYYNLHRHLNDPLFHSFCALMSLFIIHYSLFISEAQRAFSLCPGQRLRYHLSYHQC